MIQRQNHRNLSDYPEIRNAEGKRVCLIYSKVLQGQQRKYCSEDCSNEMLVRNSHQALKVRVTKERGAICEHCKKDCGDLLNNNLTLDHIKPIALGGEEFSKANVQLLCSECNRIKTRQDSRDIAEQRRKEKLEAKGQTFLETNKYQKDIPNL